VRFAAAWHRFWFTPGRAEDLAICRILFAAGMFLVGLSNPIHEWGEVPAFYQRPADFLRLLGIPILDTGVLQGIEFVWLSAMVTLALGWYSRTSAAIVCLGSLYLFGIDAPDFLGRSYTPGVFVPAILAVSYCGDVLSVDAWRRRRRGRVINRPAEEYGWPARLVCTFLSYVFFAAGVAKIRETGFPDWMLSDQTTRNLLIGHYWYASRNRALWPFGAQLLQIYAGAGVTLGVITQFAELLYPLALFVRAARLTVVPVMLAILIGITVTMGPFFHLTMLAHVFWVPWSSVDWQRRR
jgi:vitamin K-dependent gamma-carboxylase-like protein